jgi:hypothetical protein
MADSGIPTKVYMLTFPVSDQKTHTHFFLKTSFCPLFYRKYSLNLAVNKIQFPFVVRIRNDVLLRVGPNK